MGEGRREGAPLPFPSLFLPELLEHICLPCSSLLHCQALPTILWSRNLLYKKMHTEMFKDVLSHTVVVEARDFSQLWKKPETRQHNAITPA